MKSYLGSLRQSRLQSAIAASVLAFFFTAASVGAATTIGANISTGGTLAVTGASTLTGLTTMVYASSTGQSLTGNLMVNGYATTTGSSGNIETAGTLTVIGTSSFTGRATMVYASTTSISTSVASTTNLSLGAGSTLAGMIFGTCNITQESITASSTKGLVCASATGITTAYKVFVSATSTLAGGAVSNAVQGFTIQAASSTAADTIGVLISNGTGANNTPSGTLNFWAVR